MNSVFGSGNWRLTGGYRTPERENELRAEGALTVPPGVTSRHSMGTLDAPGAYDVVVDGMSPAAAAARLREAKASFNKLLPEGTHGSQGAHLHVEPQDLGLRRGARPSAPVIAWRVVEPTAAERELTALRGDAERGSASAQLETAKAYARGYGAPRDRVAALYWATLAAANVEADAAERAAAEMAVRALTKAMSAEERSLSSRLSARSGTPAPGQMRTASAKRCTGPVEDESGVVLIAPMVPHAALAGEAAEPCPGG